MEYLRKTYPDNIFEEICAGVGGTGSVLGVVRIEHDLLVHTPDIVFIEFSVNDGSDSPSHRIAMEGMIRKVLRKNGGTIVSVLGTATVGTFADYDNGNLPGAVFAHKQCQLSGKQCQRSGAGRSRNLMADGQLPQTGGSAAR